MMIFSAPRASNVSVAFARSPDRATDGNFLSENVVHTDFLTDDEVQTGRWLDEDQLDPGKYFVMLSASAEDSCWSYPPPDYVGILDPACADGFSDVAVLEITKPPQTFQGRVQVLRYSRVVYLTLTVQPLGEKLPYKVCWNLKTKRRRCLSSTVPGYSWDSSADDSLRVRMQGMAKTTTFTWYVNGRNVASKRVKTPSLRRTTAGQPRSGTAGSTRFQTPSGNILCAASWKRQSGFVECWVLSTATSHHFPYAWLLLPRRPVRRILPGDGPGYGRKLAYGRSWHGGPFKCLSRTTGLKCWNATSGHGFYLAREFQRTF